MVFPQSAPILFLSQHQLLQAAHRPLDAFLGSTLGAIRLGILPLAAFVGIPELALQLFRPREQAAPEQFLRRGLDFSFYLF